MDPNRAELKYDVELHGYLKWSSVQRPASSVQVQHPATPGPVQSVNEQQVAR